MHAHDCPLTNAEALETRLLILCTQRRTGRFRRSPSRSPRTRRTRRFDVESEYHLAKTRGTWPGRWRKPRRCRRSARLSPESVLRLEPSEKLSRWHIWAPKFGGLYGYPICPRRLGGCAVYSETTISAGPEYPNSHGERILWFATP